jgi:hypothetical protein
MNMKKYAFLLSLSLILIVSIFVIRPFSLHAEQLEGKSPFAAIADSLSSLSVKKLFQSNPNQPQKAFSAIGTISEIGEQKLTLSQADGSDQSNDTEYVIDASGARFETKDYAPLVFADIKVGDRVIAKGFIRGSEIFARRIISMTATTTANTATTTQDVATSTPDTATTTQDIATSTPDTATTTTTTNTATTTTDVSTTTSETQTPVDTNTSTTTPIESSSAATSTQGTSSSENISDQPTSSSEQGSQSPPTQRNGDVTP